MVKKANTVPNTEVEPSAEPEAVQGTTSRLFDTPVPEGVEPPKAAVEGEETATPAPQAGPTDTATEQPAPQEFDGQKVKVKVDGEEREISFEELIKSYQTNTTIAQRGQELGTQRQALADERKGFEELKAKVEAMTQGVPQGAQPTQLQGIPGVDMDMLDETTKNALIAQQANYDAGMAQINQTLQQLSVGLQPMQIEQEHRTIDSILKAENPAFNDYVDKVAEIEMAIMALPVEEQAVHTTRIGYMNIYKGLKVRDLAAQQAGSTETPTLVPRTESGAGVPSGVDGEASKNSKLFANAKESSAIKDIRDGRQVDPNVEWAKYFDAVR